MIDGTLSLSKLDYRTLDEQQQAIYKDWIVLSSVGLVILVLLYCVVVIFDLIKRQRKVSLYKLNGLSLQAIFQDIFSLRIMTFLIVVLVIGVSGYVVIVNNGVLLSEYVYWWVT